MTDLLWMGKEHIALSSLAPDLLTVSFNGLSKSHLIAGYRCGMDVLCGEKKHAKGYIEGIKLLQLCVYVQMFLHSH